MVRQRRTRRSRRQSRTVALEEIVFGNWIKAEDGRVEVRAGGGCLLLLGIWFLLLGCWAIVFGNREFHDAIERVAVSLVGALFALVGVLAAFGRYRLEIDAYSGTYRKGYSLLVFFKQTSGSLDEFDTVTLTREVSRIRGKNNVTTTTTLYPIRLAGSQGTLDIASRSTLEQARTEAEKVAKALSLPLADRTGRREVVREPEYLDESVRERRRRTGERLDELPPRPEGMKTQVRIEGNEIILEIPPAGLTGAAVGRLAAAILFVSFVIMFFLRPLLDDLKQGPDLLTCVFIGFLSLFFILLPLSLSVGPFLRTVRARCTLRVSSNRLRITTRGVFFSHVCDIPADELEELQAQSSDDDSSRGKEEIVARSDRTTARFGRHLPQEEKEWIKAVIEHLLAG